MSISVSQTPISQTVVTGAKNFTFADYVLDSASGEDIRVISIPLSYSVREGRAGDIINCRLYDGATQLTAGVNPTSANSALNFVFDGGGLIIPKVLSGAPANTSAVKLLALKCDVAASADGKYAWGLADNSAAYTGAVGVASGRIVQEIMRPSVGQYMTAIQSGSLSAVLDANSPALKIVSAGSTNVELAKIRFTARDEDIDLRQIALVLSDPSFNTPVDLANRQVTLWDGATQIGSAIFPTGDNAVSNLISLGNFRIPKDAYKVLTVKGDIASISAGSPLISSGDLLKVDLDTHSPGGTYYGVGLSSANIIRPQVSGYTNSAGVQIIKSFPNVSIFSLPSNTINRGVEAHKRIFRLGIKADNAGDIGVGKISFRIDVNGPIGVSNVNLFTYADPDFSAISDFPRFYSSSASGSGNGQTASYRFGFYLISASGTPYTIPAGITRYFEVQADLENKSTDGSGDVTVSLLGDSTYRSIDTFRLIASDLDGNFVWTPISITAISTVNNVDWSNGYIVPGLGLNLAPQVFTPTR